MPYSLPVHVMIDGIVDLGRCGNDYGSFMMYVGAIHGQDRWLLPFMHRRIKVGYSMIFYGSINRDIMDSISSGKGWFLGPMDGERSLGHGGYIDL